MRSKPCSSRIGASRRTATRICALVAPLADHADHRHVARIVGIDQPAMHAHVLPAAHFEEIRGSLEIGDAAIEADRLALSLQLFEDIRQGFDADALPAQLLLEEQRVAVGHAVMGADIEETPRRAGRRNNARRYIGPGRSANETARCSPTPAPSGCWRAPCPPESGRPLRRLGVHAASLEQLAQLARAVHLAHDVAAADELALHVELRDGRPAG